MQWHPFSVSSSPLGGNNHVSIVIKVLGDWSEKLRGRILDGPMEANQLEQPLQPHSNLRISIEGPYGHESPYHLTYIFYSFIYVPQLLFSILRVILCWKPLFFSVNKQRSLLISLLKEIDAKFAMLHREKLQRCVDTVKGKGGECIHGKSF